MPIIQCSRDEYTVLKVDKSENSLFQNE